MNSVGPSLLDFSRAAAQAADTSRIKVSGQNVGSTKLPTWASTNHAAMTAFVEAMRRELGSVIADAGAHQKTPGVLLIVICSASEVKGVCVGRMNDMCERFLRVNGKMHSSGEIIS